MKLHLLLFCVTIPLVAADIIKIENKTPVDLWCSVYYYAKSESTRATEPQMIGVGKTIEIERPARKVDFDRQVYFGIDLDMLREKLLPSEAKYLPNFNIGVFKIGALIGNQYEIVFINGEFRGYNRFDKVIQPILDSIKGTFQKFTDAMYAPLQNQYGNYMYKNQPATVRREPGLGGAEQRYLANHVRYVQPKVEEFINQRIDKNAVPRIAFCASGGGYRAMVTVLGSLIGAEKSGLLPMVTYVAGLSGSTWTLAPWTAIGMPLEEFRTQLSQRIDTNLGQNVNTGQLLNTLWKKFVFQQSLSSIDIYGGLLSNKLIRFGKGNPYNISLNAQAKRVDGGKWIFPIYTAVLAQEPYEWVEFTPYETGCDYLGGFIPTWALGSTFNNGKSTSVAPEQHLGYCMGIWGSAFSANFKEIYNEFRKNIDSPVLLSALDAGVDIQTIGGARVFPATIANFTYGLAKAPRAQQLNITLVDAGLDFNIPLPPLLRKERAVDIIVVLDNSATVAGAPALVKAADYAKRKNVQFPQISLEKELKPCTVFKDVNNPNIPVIIYMPLVKNPGYSKTFDPNDCTQKSYCNTNNFSYTAEQVMELSGLTEYNMKECTPIIMQEIKECVERKNKLITPPQKKVNTTVNRRRPTI